MRVFARTIMSLRFVDDILFDIHARTIMISTLVLALVLVRHSVRTIMISTSWHLRLYGESQQSRPTSDSAEGVRRANAFSRRVWSRNVEPVWAATTWAATRAFAKLVATATRLAVPAAHATNALDVGPYPAADAVDDGSARSSSNAADDLAAGLLRWRFSNAARRRAFAHVSKSRRFLGWAK